MWHTFRWNTGSETDLNNKSRTHYFRAPQLQRGVHHLENRIGSLRTRYPTRTLAARVFLRHNSFTVRLIPTTQKAILTGLDVSSG